MDEPNQVPVPSIARDPLSEIPPPGEFRHTDPPPSLAERVHTVFAGPQGLRAGWRLLVYLFLVAVLFFISQVILSTFRNLGSLRLMFLDKAFFVLEVTLPAIFLASMEHRSFSAYGLPARGILRKNFWIGLLWGLGAVSLLILLLRVFGAYEFGNVELHGHRLAEFALFWFAFFLLVGLSEEFLLRGYTLYTLTEAMKFWPVAILLSLMFGGIHSGNQGESLMGILGAAIIGFFFCLTIRRTGNLWFAVGFHASWDWGESYVYSVPDSGSLTPGHLLHAHLQGSRWITGGTVGPEGSVFLLVVMIVAWIAFDRIYRDVRYPG
jgi:hypothetical protein